MRFFQLHTQAGPRRRKKPLSPTPSLDLNDSPWESRLQLWVGWLIRSNPCPCLWDQLTQNCQTWLPWQTLPGKVQSQAVFMLEQTGIKGSQLDGTLQQLKSALNWAKASPWKEVLRTSQGSEWMTDRRPDLTGTPRIFSQQNCIIVWAHSWPLSYK